MSNSTIGEVCDRFSSGKNISSSKITAVGKYPVFGGNGLRGYTDSYNFEGECAIIGRQGAYCGNVRYFCGKAYMTEHAIVACANNDNSTGYLAYKLSLMNLQQYQGQSAQPGLSVNTLSKVKIDMPEKDIQTKIFSTLKAIDDKIQINNNINAELEKMAKTIYDYWFLQFEFPNEAGKPYKSSGGKMVWNEELKRDIPEGWKVIGVDDLGTLCNGINYDKNVQGDEEYKIVNVRDISNSNLFLNTNIISNIKLDSHIADKYLLKNNDILIARSGIPGAVRVLDANDLNTIYCGFIICFSLDSSLYKQYILYTLQLYENTSATNSGGTVMQNVSQDTLRSLRFCVPNEKIIKLFNKEILPVWDLIKKNNKENYEMISFRDFLLPLLMNGQIRFNINIE